MASLHANGSEQVGHVAFVGDIAAMQLHLAKRRTEKLLQLTYFFFRDPGHVYRCSRVDESTDDGASEGTRAACHQNRALHDERLADSGQEIK